MSAGEEEREGGTAIGGGGEEEAEEEVRKRLPSEIGKSDRVDVFDFSELEPLGPELGRGAFSTVYLGTFRGEPVAIKQIRIPSSKSLEGKADQRYLRTEVAMLKAMAHENLIKYVGIALKGRFAYVCTELLSGGSMQDVIFGKGAREASADAPVELPELPWSVRVFMARGTIHGLSYLHSKDVVHRDVKPDNVLLGNAWRCVLADYGFARRAAAGTAMTICGTDEFMAPEVIWGEEYDTRADIFSFGMVLVELITRRQIGKDGFLERKPRNKFELDMDELNEAIPEDCPPSFAECARQCLAYEPDERLESEPVKDWLDDLWKEVCETEGLDPEKPPSFPMPQFAASKVAASSPSSEPPTTATTSPPPSTSTTTTSKEQPAPSPSIADAGEGGEVEKGSEEGVGDELTDEEREKCVIA